MPTTIQLREDTLQRLKEAKAETGARSYDELIRDLLKKAVRRKSRFGAHPKMAPFEHGRTSHGD
jgi:predicted CopG family antitoxin